jgi:hypothetical protein
MPLVISHYNIKNSAHYCKPGYNKCRCGGNCGHKRQGCVEHQKPKQNLQGTASLEVAISMMQGQELPSDAANS